MSAWRGIVGKSFTPDEFEKYVASLKFGLWRPKFIVVHNTSAPDLKTWRGWQARKPPITDEKWAQNLVGYYRDQQRWPAGPHLFVTPRGILAFSPLTGPGTHSPAWNSITWGVETVGEFEHEPFAGAVRDNLVAALAILHAAAALQPMPYERGVHGLHFHKEDPVTTHKSCPGCNMVKADLIAAVEAEILRRHPGGGHRHADTAPLTLMAPDADGAGDDQAPAPSPAPCDPLLLDVQGRLKAMRYNPGTVDGDWGGMTAGAIGGFINDRNMPIGAPTSAAMFDTVAAELGAEIDRAEAEGFVRPVSAARAAGDLKTVAETAPEVVPVHRNFLVTAWSAIAAFFYGIWNAIGDKVSRAWDFFTDHKDDIPTDPSTLSAVWEHLGRVPAAVWIIAAAVGLAFLAFNSLSGVKKITEQVQSGVRQ